jgi:pyruvate carboxylase
VYLSTSIDLEERPGAYLPDYDFDKAEKLLKDKYGAKYINGKDVLSHATYPNVFSEWKEFESVYGEVSKLRTNLFLVSIQQPKEGSRRTCYLRGEWREVGHARDRPFCGLGCQHSTKGIRSQ